MTTTPISKSLKNEYLEVDSSHKSPVEDNIFIPMISEGSNQNQTFRALHSMPENQNKKSRCWNRRIIIYPDDQLKIVWDLIMFW